MELLERAFQKMGARVKFDQAAPRRMGGRWAETEYGQMSEGERRRWGWPMMRNPKVYARGRVRHPDHATVTLDGWHEVFSNTEHLSDAMRDVVFLD